MFLMPSEQAFVQKLEQRQIVLKKLSSRASSQLTIQPVLEKMNAENKDLQHLAKRAVVSYLRSVHLMRDKSVFKIEEIDKQKLATSYGLLNAPTVEVVSRKDKTDRVAMLREQAQARKMAKQLGKEMQEDDSSVEEQSQNSDEDDFFQKAAQRDLGSEAESDEQPALVSKVSKNKLRKITADGPFKGKNVTVFGPAGQTISKDEHERQKYIQSLSKNFKIRNEDDLSEEEDGDAYIGKVRKTI